MSRPVSFHRSQNNVFHSVMKLDILAQVYTPETIAALGRYRQHLGDVRERLAERQTLASEELQAYDGREGGSKQATEPMDEIVQRYVALVKEVEAVKKEISRLE